MSRAIGRSKAQAPDRLTLSEASRLSGKTEYELRVEVSRARLDRMSHLKTVNLTEAAWLLCISRYAMRELVQRGDVSARARHHDGWMEWEIPLSDVQALATDREEGGPVKGGRGGAGSWA